MKPFIKSWKILAIASTFAATTALAQTNTISIDETGKGFYNGLAIPGVLLAADPSGGVVGPVLVYTLPGAPLTIGDVVLLETAAGGNTNGSDVIRFWEFNQVIFYSDREPGDPNPDLADISGLPAQLLANRVTLTESGVEGNNGASYFASPGLPGASAPPGFNQYQFISDIPEPGSVLLSSLGGGLLLLRPFAKVFRMPDLNLRGIVASFRRRCVFGFTRRYAEE
jgi:hypothetical protein